MICSEARLAANRLNALKSTGPKTPEGKAASRRNGLKHGLAGDGVVAAEEEAEEIATRAEALRDDLKPRSTAGALLIRQMATLSLRTERAAEHESARIALRVRHAADEFDEERVDRAEALFRSLGEDLRTNLRRLRKMPEGVERMVAEWADLRADLTDPCNPSWEPGHARRAATLMGERFEHAMGSRFGALSRACWGDFDGLGEGDGGGLPAEARRGWARRAVAERIEAEVAALIAHHETLDYETLGLDRDEAGSRALFDPSKEAALARRYEAEARRGFRRALEEFREVEAEVEARSEEVVQAPPAAPTPPPPGPAMGSSRRIGATPAVDRLATPPGPSRFAVPTLLDAELASPRPARVAP